VPKCYPVGMETLREAVRLARAGEPVALATVIQISGSAPRHLGAKMLVRADSSIFGTIGGGRVEEVVREAGAEVASGAPARRAHHHLTQDLGMCCGGAMEFYLEPVAQSLSALEISVELLSQRKPVLLTTPLDGSAKTAEECSADHPRQAQCDGGFFVEPLWPRERLVLFGCGHVARAIGPLAVGVGFDVVVCDDDETGALSDAPDWAHAVVESFDVRDIEREVGALGPTDYVVILTREHALDLRALEALLPRESLSYLGMIGSRKKVGRFRERLLAKGVATEQRWARLHAPIGLDIGGETPEEIALSVVAELIKVRNQG